MRHFSTITALALIAGLGGCAPSNQDTTRLNSPLLSIQAQDSDAADVADQANALNRLADDLVRHSTIKGTQAGAIIGCGLVVVSVGNARNCLFGAVAGGLSGAAIGRAIGQNDVEKRVELVSANALVNNIRGMNGHMESLNLSLPELLAEQDAELSHLKKRLDTGVLSPAQYTSGVGMIRQTRGQIADALSATITRAETARDNLQEASQQGHYGLQWHIGATSNLAEQAASARSTISLL